MVRGKDNTEHEPAQPQARQRHRYCPVLIERYSKWHQGPAALKVVLLRGLVVEAEDNRANRYDLLDLRYGIRVQLTIGVTLSGIPWRRRLHVFRIMHETLQIPQGSEFGFTASRTIL